jgi:hypothetical protein
MECQYDGILGDSENKLYNRGWTPLLARLIVNLKRDSWYRRADERTVFVSVIGHQELWTPLQLFFTEQMPNQHKKGPVDARCTFVLLSETTATKVRSSL